MNNQPRDAEWPTVAVYVDGQMVGHVSHADLKRGPHYHGGFYEFTLPVQSNDFGPDSTSDGFARPLTISVIERLQFRTQEWIDNFGWNRQSSLVINARQLPLLQRWPSFVPLAEPAPATQAEDDPPVTAARINALSPRLRSYIHDLETRADPTGDVQTIHSQRDQIAGLVARVRELESRQPAPTRDALIAALMSCDDPRVGSPEALADPERSARFALSRQSAAAKRADAIMALWEK